MEIRLIYGIFLYVVQLVLFKVAALPGNECRLCKPGYYASRLCSDTHDTVCKPCSTGTFSAKPNVLRQCSPCSKCDVGEFVFKECSKSKDIVCKSCDTFNGLTNHSFIRNCRHNKIDQSKGRIHSIFNVIHYKRHKRSDENDKSNIILESSGESVIEEIEAINDTSEVEGSGIISEVDDIKDTNATYATPILLAEDDGKEDETVAGLTMFTRTTVKTEVIEEGTEGIILKNTSDVVKTNILMGRKNKEQQTTTTFGISVITTEDKSGLMETDNQPELIEEQEDIPDELNQEDRRTELQSGASQLQGKEKKSYGTSIAVVVTVGLVAALIFFILGFVANKYWSGRRERTFDVREAERQKNKPGQISDIEYRDIENIKSKGICDEIQANVNGKASDKRPINATGTVIKRDTVPVTNAGVSPPVTEGAIGDIVDGEWAGFPEARHSSSGSLILLPPPRPTSATQYVDEDGRGDESDMLMPKPSLVGDTADETSPASSRKSNTDIQKTSKRCDESTPMLEESSERHTS